LPAASTKEEKETSADVEEEEPKKDAAMLGWDTHQAVVSQTQVESPCFCMHAYIPHSLTYFVL
jgi:hypothetical protein